MKPQDIIKAIAELDGWKPNPIAGGMYPPDLHPAVNINKVFELSPYLTSRDAIVPVIEKQDLVTKSNWLYILSDMVYHQHKNTYLVSLFVTPSQLCEALLRSTGKWVE